MLSSNPNASYQIASQLAFLFRRRRQKKKIFLRWLQWRRSWIADRNGFSCFDQQVILMLLTKFQVNWPFGSGDEAKNRCSRWQPRRPPWISDRNDFSYF